ncbi:TYRO protein tyrosine kinase-binding protein [Dunckerocampus dactyliophorus]|uniref:TYRO protein tyrosine kinase-binding protein n=1 Tax=Dunckerocampus dactyliophorus TaxID=161453 RepID=UPI002405F930|nr:TYRO protein tyrosine kinase-binding protein [Dunckerocampus dactyliophorus]
MLHHRAWHGGRYCLRRCGVDPLPGFPHLPMCGLSASKKALSRRGLTSSKFVSSSWWNITTVPQTSMKDTLCIGGSLFGSTGQQECGSCYLISMQSVVGMITSDIILTVFITISVFYFVTLHKKKAELNVATAKEEKPAETTESPYQELHGVQSDVYSELQH